MNAELSNLIARAQGELGALESTLREVEAAKSQIEDAVEPLRALVLRLEEARERLSTDIWRYVSAAASVARSIPGHLIETSLADGSAKNLVRVHPTKFRFEIHRVLRDGRSHVENNLTQVQFMVAYNVIEFCQNAFAAAESHLAQSRRMSVDARALQASLATCAEIAKRLTGAHPVAQPASES